jgi:hypothetical protein
MHGWVRNSNGAGDEIAAANRALIGGERRVWDANFAYQMAVSSGDAQKIHAAEKALQAALAEDIRRKGGRHEDVLMMQRSFLGESSVSFKWLPLLGLVAVLFYLAK